MIEPVNPFQRRVLDGVDVAPGTTTADDLGLVQPVDRLGQGVIVRVTNTADRRVNSRFSQAFRVADRQILTTPVAVMNQVLRSGS